MDQAVGSGSRSVPGCGCLSRRGAVSAGPMGTFFHDAVQASGAVRALADGAPGRACCLVDLRAAGGVSITHLVGQP